MIAEAVRREQAVGGSRSLCGRAAFGFIALSLLLAPLFAHGCHGDDVDHEPALTPLRSNPEER